ncbi:MAG: VWA domain-containing protein [Acidobacteria bacterium]|nr:VWA domain-containing protein [Acidobacteriota bacterium]
MRRSSTLIRRMKQEKGMAIVAAAVILMILVPMVGLAIDVSMLFISKTRLQGAVDGAALAGAKSLARGTNGAAQIASAQNAAIAYVKTNFPNGYFFSSELTIPTPTVDLSVQYQRSVVVTADVQVPAMFERILGFTNTTVKASATATRKDVNIVIAFDRSGSLQQSGSCEALKSAAKNFIDQFANLRDNVGIITFATTSWVDFALQNNFNPTAKNVIGGLSCAGSTSTAQAMWQSYSQLVGLNQPGAMNVILLFTDGQPTGLAVDMVLKPTSGCAATTYTTDANGNHIIRGHYGIYVNYSGNFGMLKWQYGPQPIPNGDINMVSPSTGCAFASNMSNLNDYSYLPDRDIFGNNLDNGYNPITRSSGHIVVTSTTNMKNATLNAADDAAERIRNAAVDPAWNRGLSGITIYSIGLGNSTLPASPTFLRRVANDPQSPIYNPNKPAGLYVYAANTTDLAAAFRRVASEVLRLAK